MQAAAESAAAGRERELAQRGPRLSLGLLAPPYLPVPPQRYGGVERVVAYLADALVELGHEVVLYAGGDSATRAKLVPTLPRAKWSGNLEEDGCAAYLAVAKAYASIDGLDLLHNHLGHRAFLAARRTAVPTLTTVHWPLDLAAAQEVYREFAELPLVALSQAQMRALPEAGWIGAVGNGIPRDLYRFVERPGDWLAFCGRLYPEKGAAAAMRAAIAGGMPIKVAGQVPSARSADPWTRRARAYYEAEVEPLFRHRLVEYVGELDDAGKQELYGARALLAPADWPEPFGLVAVEALACGTPVVATRRGALPEIVRDGVTGALCDSAEALLHGIRKAEGIDRRACRAEFEARFTSLRMAQDYESLYRKLSRPEHASHSRAPLSEAQRRRYEAHLAEILAAFGMRLDTPGTRGTPARMLRALWEATEGYEGDAKLLTAFPAESEGGARKGQQVVEGPIAFYALCEHHVLPFFGRAWVGYVPGRELIGLSKLTRMVRLYARRFTFQERIGEQVAGELARRVGAAGVAVRLDAEHLCTQMRGVAEPGVRTATTTWQGCYEDNTALRAEFNALCAAACAPR